MVVVDEDGGQLLVGQEGELDEGDASLVLLFAEQTALPCFRLSSVLEEADLALDSIAAEGDEAEVVLANILVVLRGVEYISQVLEYYGPVSVLLAGLLLEVVGVGVAGDWAEIAVGALQLARGVVDHADLFLGGSEGEEGGFCQFEGGQFEPQEGALEVVDLLAFSSAFDHLELLLHQQKVDDVANLSLAQAAADLQVLEILLYFPAFDLLQGNLDLLCADNFEAGQDEGEGVELVADVGGKFL